MDKERAKEFIYYDDDNNIIYIMYAKVDMSNQSHRTLFINPAKA